MSARILIADDSPAVRRGLRHLLGKNPDWEICGEAIDGLDAVDKAQHLTPDLIVLDYFMPKLNAVEAARELVKLVPGVPPPCGSSRSGCGSGPFSPGEVRPHLRLVDCRSSTGVAILPSLVP